MLGNKHLGWIALVVIALVSVVTTSVGCAPPEMEEDEGRGSSESHFAMLDVQRNGSLLTVLEKTKGQPDVCVGLIGYADATAREAAFKAVQTQVDRATNAWNGRLKGTALWTLQDKIQPKYRSQTTTCVAPATGFAVNLWQDAARFKKEFCAANRMTESNCSSAALPWNNAFFLGPWNRTQPDDPLDAFTILHEYGHLLGLGDTYTIKGVNEFEGEQPDSVMNGRSRVLTKDDGLGLIATLRTVKTGVRSCNGVGDDAALTTNGFHSVMCVSNAVPVISHPGRPTGPVLTGSSSSSSSGGSSSSSSSGGSSSGFSSSSGGSSSGFSSSSGGSSSGNFGP